uniref:Protein tweety homolog n=1 Tax=Salmo trutta TaxID=8032 RepID=A0A673VXL4_SALTR
MATARLDYIAPWWTYWLHNFPHFNFTFQTVDNTFRPGEASYQQSLVFLACISAAGLVLSLLLLSVYLTSVCCCRKEEEEETKRPDSCCVSWTAVITGLILCSAVGVGFYGNSQTNDGVYQLTYSLHNANHTLGGINGLVSSSLGSMEVGLQQHLKRLDEIFATRGDYVQALRFMGQMADNIIRQLTSMPELSKAKVDLSAIADQTDYGEYYRWLTYLLLLILDLVICLVALAGTHSALCNNWYPLLTHYYLYCSQSLPNPFQQSLTIFQRSLTTMQIQIQGLLQFSVPVFPTAERDLLGIQRLLNSTEFNLNQLTVLLDCRGLHKNYLDGLMGVCYDGVEGLLYLCLFSLLSVSAFCVMLCAIARAWTLITSRDRDYDDIDEEDPFNPQARHMAFNPSRASHVHSFCSYSSSLDSQASPHPPPQTAAILPTSEYMNQSMLFGGNPRYENVPLIRRGSPPPSYSPRMRTTYLSMTDAQIRHFGTDFQQV